MRNSLTIIKSKLPDRVCKVFSEIEDGSLRKDAIANIHEGSAKTIRFSDTNELADLLRIVSEKSDLALCPSIWWVLN